MAMNAITLSAAIRTELIATAGAEDNDATEKLAEVIATAVVYHLENYALVTVATGIAVATTGTASAQTGATTEGGTGTIS